MYVYHSRVLYLVSDLVCHVCLESKRAPLNSVTDVHIDVLAVAHGKVVLAPADRGEHQGFVHFL